MHAHGFDLRMEEALVDAERIADARPSQVFAELLSDPQ